MIQAIKAKYIITPNQSFVTDSAVIIKNNIKYSECFLVQNRAKQCVSTDSLTWWHILFFHSAFRFGTTLILKCFPRRLNFYLHCSTNVSIGLAAMIAIQFLETLGSPMDLGGIPPF